ncbi:MAG: nitroreductase/quinone reductase family protein [Chloroflexota bacterium]
METPTTTPAGSPEGAKGSSPFLPPRWIIRSAWVGHRAIRRLSGGRRGLSTPVVGGKFGLMELHTVGRRSGRERMAILGYREEGAAIVTLAMNGWADPEPAWFLNLQAQPDARVVLDDGERLVRARVATGEERARLWAAWTAYAGYGGDLDGYARRRSRETAVVVLDPRPADA